MSHELASAFVKMEGKPAHGTHGRENATEPQDMAGGVEMSNMAPDNGQQRQPTMSDDGTGGGVSRNRELAACIQARVVQACEGSIGKIWDVLDFNKVRLL